MSLKRALSGSRLTLNDDISSRNDGNDCALFNCRRFVKNRAICLWEVLPSNLWTKNMDIYVEFSLIRFWYFFFKLLFVWIIELYCLSLWVIIIWWNNKATENISSGVKTSTKLICLGWRVWQPWEEFLYP